MDEDIDVIWMRERIRPLLPEKVLPRFDAIVDRLAQNEAEDAVAAAIDRQTARLEELVERNRPRSSSLWEFLTKEQRP